MMPIPNRDAVALSARTLGALFSYAPNSAEIAPLVAAFQDGSWQQQWPFPVAAPLASGFAASAEETLPEAWQRLFIWLMDYSHRGFVKLKLAPPWQLALGGLIVGGLSLITPAVWGNGYSVVQSYLLLPPSGALLVGVFICKLLAVLASSGSGAPGGVFTPTLFVGLAMGMLFACFSRLWLPGSEEMAIMMGLTGMAAFLAATTHAPIMSTLMICEMTGQYTLLPGLLITCVVSSVLSRTLRRDSIYRHHVAEHV